MEGSHFSNWKYWRIAHVLLLFELISKHCIACGPLCKTVHTQCTLEMYLGCCVCYQEFMLSRSQLCTCILCMPHGGFGTAVLGNSHKVILGTKECSFALKTDRWSICCESRYSWIKSIPQLTGPVWAGPSLWEIQAMSPGGCQKPQTAPKCVYMLH